MSIGLPSSDLTGLSGYFCAKRILAWASIGPAASPASAGADGARQMAAAHSAVEAESPKYGGVDLSLISFTRLRSQANSGPYSED